MHIFSMMPGLEGDTNAVTGLHPLHTKLWVREQRPSSTLVPCGRRVPVNMNLASESWCLAVAPSRNPGQDSHATSRKEIALAQS